MIVIWLNFISGYCSYYYNSFMLIQTTTLAFALANAASSDAGKKCNLARSFIQGDLDT